MLTISRKTFQHLNWHPIATTVGRLKLSRDGDHFFLDASGFQTLRADLQGEEILMKLTWRLCDSDTTLENIFNETDPGIYAISETNFEVTDGTYKPCMPDDITPFGFDKSAIINALKSVLSREADEAKS